MTLYTTPLRAAFQREVVDQLEAVARQIDAEETGEIVYR